MPPRIPDDGDKLGRLARRLLARGGALQSTAGGERVDAPALRRAIEQHMAAHAPTVAASTLGGPDLAPTADAIAADAQRALDTLAGGASASSLDDRAISALQAIVLVVGRPALDYRDGHVAMPPEAGGENDAWRVWVAQHRKRIDTVSRSIGLVSIEVAGGSSEPLGTAWRIGKDLAVTNRHVVTTIVVDPRSAPSEWQLDAGKQVRVDFANTTAATTHRFAKVTALAFCSSVEELDLAVLRLVPDGGALPAALTVDWELAALGAPRDAGDGEAARAGEKVYVVGHPFRELLSGAIRSVFGVPDGRKRCSPGYVTVIPENGSPVFEHDCSTLAGNSGSCVLSYDHDRVVGLHFGGRDVSDRTGVGAANLAIAFSALPEGPARKMLRQGSGT